MALACAAGHGRIIKMLLRKGADVNAANSDGNTPLHLAAANGRKAIVKFLVSNKADADARNNDSVLYSDLMANNSLLDTGADVM